MSAVGGGSVEGGVNVVDEDEQEYLIREEDIVKETLKEIMGIIQND